MKPHVIILSAVIVSGCASVPEYPAIKSNPIEILDLISWEDNTLFEVNAIPVNIIRVLYNYNYRYINFTQSILQNGDAAFEGPVSIFIRSDAYYDTSDDTFVFQGRFYPAESGTVTYRDIWMIFSQEENYKLFMDHNVLKTEKEGYAVQANYSLKKRTVE
jgi:hypothetical protein